MPDDRSKNATQEELSDKLKKNEENRDKTLEILEEEQKRKREARQKDHDEEVRERESDVNTARAELEYAAKAAAEKARLGAGPKRGDLPGLGLPGDLAGRATRASLVTFSAAAALGNAGQGRDRQLAVAVEQRNIQKNFLKEAERMRKKLDVLDMAARA